MMQIIILAAVCAILVIQLFILKQNKKIMATLADIQNEVASLEQTVQAEDTIIDSAVTLIGGFTGVISGLQQQLTDALAASDPAALQAVVDSMEQTKTEIDAKAGALAAAVAANTPAAQS